MAPSGLKAVVGESKCTFTPNLIEFYVGFCACLISEEVFVFVGV